MKVRPFPLCVLCAKTKVLATEIYDELRNALYNDNAVAGEAAGYAMGLVMLGTASSKALDEMLQYAHETQHEKIIRGLAIGMAFLMYGKQEEADGLIETLGADKVGRQVAHSDFVLIWRRSSSTGSDSSLWWNLHHRHGLRRNRKQQSHPQATARRRIRHQRRCPKSCCYRPRFPPLPQP